jgi:hypothetical protein
VTEGPAGCFLGFQKVEIDSANGDLEYQNAKTGNGQTTSEQLSTRTEFVSLF